MTPKHLVLFDIDGTLISTNGHGVNAMMEAYHAVWGADGKSVAYSMSGKTEFQISHELLKLLGYDRVQVNQGLPEFFRHYPQALRRHLTPERTVVHPGVRELVAQIKTHPETVLGLLTGNCEEAARIKMEIAGLEGFEVGAYGEHHENRADLPQLAVEHARLGLGLEFSGRQLVIIGDTPNDIHCARAAGGKAIAVATGQFDTRALASHEPDFVFENLAQVEQVMGAILS